MNRTLYAITGIFNTPDEIINAAEKTSEAGYNKYDIHTPYPVHGMDKAMKLPPSKLAYASLIFGLSGIAAALLLIPFMVVFDYPSVIGGKPFFSFPAFIPVIFEITVLSSSIATVATMLFFMFKFPNLSHPLHGTSYMKKVSSDKYGLTIQSDDEYFSKEQVVEFISSLGASEIEEIYYDEEEINLKHKLFEPRFVMLLLVIALIVSGASYFTLNKAMFLPPFNWMMEQDKSLPQQKSEFFSDGFSMRQPVDGTVARGEMPYKYSGKPEEAEKFLSNPLIPTEENLHLGKVKFDIYCSPCHGYLGEGDSRLRGQFPNPPSLHSKKVAQWNDARIYHILTDGQNIMPNYSSQLTRKERWATVLYIRALQRALNAKESDLK